MLLDFGCVRFLCALDGFQKRLVLALTPAALHHLYPLPGCLCLPAEIPMLLFIFYYFYIFMLLKKNCFFFKKMPILDFVILVEFVIL